MRTPAAGPGGAGSVSRGGVAGRRPPRVVVLGGGTGLSTLLTGLKAHTDDITAVVTVTDEGGSSGRLRRARGVLPPGDLRNCLVALAEDDTLVSRLFQYRFPKALSNGHGRAEAAHDDSLEGHAFGNLLLTALSDVAGGLDKAIRAASQVLAIRGRVLPASLEPVRLRARLVDGRRVLGEPAISRSRSRIRRVELLPSGPDPAPGVLEALAGADLIVLGPGSLYTSVIPPLLVRGVAGALSRARGLKVYVCNVMSQPGETDGYGADDHLRALLDHGASRRGGGRLVDVMLVNDRPFPAPVLRHYARFGAAPVARPERASLGPVRVVRAALCPALSLDRARATPQARHSPARLAAAVWGLLKKASPGAPLRRAPRGVSPSTL